MVCPCLGSIRLTALCKLSWGHFLLYFLPPLVLPMLAWDVSWRQCPPLDAGVRQGTDAVAGAASQEAGEELWGTHSTAQVAGSGRIRGGMEYLGTPRGVTGNGVVTWGHFCLSQPLLVPREGVEQGTGGLQPDDTSHMVMLLEGTVAISPFLGGKAVASAPSDC